MLNYQVANSNNKAFCPYPKCEEVNMISSKNQKKTKCSKCEGIFCAKCKAPWHENKTCKQNQKEMYKDWAANVGAHRCPKCKTL